jgi:DNA-binding NarL/FixJ family response regulator
MVRILLVDDHEIFRAGVRQWLSTDATLEVVSEAGSGKEAMEQLQQNHPDLVLLDISLPDGSGIDLLGKLLAAQPQLAVLFFSTHPATHFAAPLLRAGARGYLCKDATPQELLRAIRLVAEGQRYAPVGAASILQAPHRSLSHRELQVFTRIARGLPPAVTAAELQLSVKTVGTYRTRILEKLGVASNAEVAAYAVRNRLLDAASA